MYNTEQFNPDDVIQRPVIQNSVVKSFDFDSTKKYQIDSFVRKGMITEKRRLFETTENEFYEF